MDSAKLEAMAKALCIDLAHGAIQDKARFFAFGKHDIKLAHATPKGHFSIFQLPLQFPSAAAWSLASLLAIEDLEARLIRLLSALRAAEMEGEKPTCALRHLSSA